MLAALLATLLLAAASALPTATVVPGCYDDNGAQVDYWLAIKLPSSFHVCHSAGMNLASTDPRTQYLLSLPSHVELKESVHAMDGLTRRALR